MNKVLSVLIVDDHPLARMAVRMLLEKDNLTVIGETDDGLDAMKLVRQLTPDLIIVDVDIPSLNGIEVVQRIRQDGYKGGILILTGKEGEHYIRRCAKAGADGFLSKRNHLNELHDAIRAIRGGYGYFPLNRARLDAAGSQESDDSSKISTLSLKERDVLRYLARGMKVVDIAKEMNISNKTVSTYKTRLMVKLELQNMIDIFDFAQQNNLD